MSAQESFQSGSFFGRDGRFLSLGEGGFFMSPPGQTSDWARLWQLPQTLVAAAGWAVWQTDAAGAVMGDCAVWRGWTGQTLESFQGWGWLKAVLPDDLFKVESRWREAIHQRGAFSMEFRVLRPEGGDRWIRVFGAPHRSIQGQVDKWFLLGWDVSAGKEAQLQLALQKQRLHELEKRQQTLVQQREALATALAEQTHNLEEVVKRRTEELREMVVELEQMSYSMVHDMRGPLRAMSGFAGILRREAAGRLRAKELERLEHIIEAAERLDELVTDALRYKGAVHEQLTLGRVQADRLLQGMIDTYPQFQLPRAWIVIEGSFPPLLANSAALTLCLSHLLENAVKFVAPKVVPQVRIWAEVVVRTSRVRLWFEDNGIGVPPAMRSEVFKLFQRAHRDYPGTGLGLALVRKLVERMGGQAGVEPGRGSGSRFWMELPRAERG